jgi:peptidoglycan/xylan/chitin deacetylase (PgdA/CDA1 family)
MYHAVHPDKSVLSIHPDIFKKQLAWLHKHNFRVISLVDLAENIRKGGELPEKGLVLTFDDGFQSLYDYAFPILSQYGFRATVFLVPGYCGKTNDWPGQPESIHRWPLLDWDQIIQMDTAGIEFGAHTVTHVRLDEQSNESIEKEILESKRMIEAVLGHGINSFAYPYGRLDERIKQLVSQNFTAACGTRLGLVSLNSNPFELERVEIYYLRHSLVFRGLNQRWFPHYLSLRRSIRQINSTLFRRKWN